MDGVDFFGNIALVKFKRGKKLKEKKEFAKNVMKNNKSVTTVLEKTDKIKGRLRTPQTKYILGINTKEALYKENGCIFRLNIDTCYFSPRLSNERKNMADLVNKNDSVLVLFAGVAPFSIIIAKTKKPKRVVSVELGKIPSKYANENVKRNKVDDIVNVIQGDVRKVLPKLNEKFDKIIMARPQLKDSFLDATFPKISKGGIIYYHGFYEESKKDEMIDMIKSEAKKAKKNIKILNIKEAGNIGVRKFRYRVEIKVN
jgi:tRNA (guanine37-N1)-methyltransferase